MLRAVNLSDVYVFKKVAATLSFTKAARQIGVSRSAVSKQVSRLEQELGVVLINRTTRNVNLTEAGRKFDASTSDVDVTIERAAAMVRGSDLSPLGTVRFAMPSAMGALLMPAFSRQFEEDWPELRLSIELDDSLEDPVAADLDLAIRISKRLHDSSLVSRRLISTRMVLAASPTYLATHGRPEMPADLDEHRLVASRRTRPGSIRWRMRNDQGDVAERSIEYSLAFNCDEALILAGSCDAGIIYVPELLIANRLARNQLALVLDDFCDPEPIGIYAIYPQRNPAAKVKVLVDVIANALAEVARICQTDDLAPNTEFVARRQANSDADAGQPPSASRAELLND